MRQYTIVILTLFVASCGHRYKNSHDLVKEFQSQQNQKADTLIVSHHECTECSDLYVDEGELTISHSIAKGTRVFSDKDFKVCGNFPMELIDVNRFDFDPNLSFRVIGKVIRIDTNNAVGPTALFYVSSWEKFQPKHHIIRTAGIR